jgi:hypothetical protein
MIITILIGLLSTFVDYYFQKWLKSHFGGDAVRPALEGGRADFLNGIKWKFWLGPTRMTEAARLFDAALARYNSNDAAYLVELSDDRSADYSQLAKRLVAGLR